MSAKGSSLQEQLDLDRKSLQSKMDMQNTKVLCNTYILVTYVHYIICTCTCI